MESASQDYAPAKPAKRGFGKKQAIFAAIALILVTAGALFFINNSSSSSDEDISPTPTEFPTEVPTPEITESASPSAAPDTTPTGKPSPTRKAEVKSATDMNIQILNGSGEVGIAGQVRDFLQGKGYSYFETGNADNFDYSGVSVKVKSALSTYGDTLKKHLAEKYTVASDSASLPGDSIFDAVVTVGK